MQRDKEHRNRKVDLEARSVARTYDIHKLEGCCCSNVGYVASRGISPSLKSDRDSSISVPL